MTTPSVPDLSGELVIQAARLVRAARHRTGDALPAGIRVLSLLDQYGALGVGRLAELDRCSQPTMTGTVKALVERAWVAKEPDPTDARATLVTLSAAGTAALTDVRRRNADAVAERAAELQRRGAHDRVEPVARGEDVLERDAVGDHRQPWRQRQNGCPAGSR